MTWVIFIACASSAHAQWRLKALSWNIESGDASLPWVSEQIAQMEGYDVLALTEVDPDWADTLLRAAEDGEGAKGNWESDFDFVISTTGNSQRLMIIWDNLRFERVGDPVELHNLNSENLTYRSPLFIQLRHRNHGDSFLLMVNHLARGAETMRNLQATGLVDWAGQQTLPVIAMGDYNFDYDIDEGVGNAAFDQMTTSGVWQWVRPDRLLKSQASYSYNSLLDFVFVAKMPENWSGYSDILSTFTPFEDDEITADHRPVDATFLIFTIEETTPEPIVE